jgi:divalent metal cation (Fe/Co/Zn/Cd) transporter
MEAQRARPDLLLTKASYGLSICAFVGLASFALSWLVPDPTGAVLVRILGLLLFAIGAASLYALRGTGVPGELFRRATRRRE